MLVTGATGQIGSELVPVLRKRYGNKQVIALGHKRRPSKELLESGPFEFIDVIEKENMQSIVEDYEIDIIYHLASVLSCVGEENPQLVWKINMDGLHNVLEIALECSVTQVFWPSSIAVFGLEAPQVDVPQNTVLIPQTMYGISKVAGELFCNYYFNKFGLDIRSIRYPGIISYKTRPGGGITDYAVEVFREAIKKNLYRCFVREDTVLPMMYMPDCIMATLTLMDANPSALSIRTSYNVTAMSFSMRELVTEIQKYFPEFKCEYKPDFRQKIADSWPRSLNDSIARRECGWSSTYDLTKMTKDIIVQLSEELKVNA